MTDVGADVVAEREAPGAFFATETALVTEGTVNDLALRDDCLIISRTAVRAGVVRNMLAVVCVEGSASSEKRRKVSRAARRRRAPA